jgi:hypothetical protein
VTVVTGKIMIMEAESPPPIRINPPWIIIIVVGIGTVIIFRPEVKLFTREEGISIFHLSQQFGLFSYNFTGHGDLLPLTENIWVKIVVSEDQESSF